MSDNDSFLDEVTEEVRRDKLLDFLRRNAIWIGAAAVLIIGGAAVAEYLRARAEAEAQATGDAIWAALQGGEAEARRKALSELSAADGAARQIIEMQTAAAALAAGDREAAIAALEALASSAETDAALRDIARLKLVMISAGLRPADERLDILTRLMAEGHALRPMAMEQRALILLEEGDAEASKAMLAELAADDGIPSAVKDRATALLIALGGEITPAEPATDG